jgi:DNA ligase D-like protein (predicted 3'-phosphoesterase)
MDEINNNLKNYREKRNFETTSEPKGEQGVTGKRPFFVVQKHKSRNLHYDLRLKVNDVLKSWAVPKGPSKNPSIRRLAVATEDHPLEYADFEGVIPVGEYGAGIVMVWDRGDYRSLKANKSMNESLEEGHVTIWFEGKKLRGGYALIRTGGGRDNRWLLIKMKDDEVDTKDILKEDYSVMTGRTFLEIT